MKIWVKYLIGVVLGVALSFALPSNAASLQDFITFCTNIAIRIGRYMVIPLVFTGCVSAVFVLRDSKQLIKSTVVIFAVIIASSLLLTVIGIVSVLLVRLPRIPISVEKVTEVNVVGIKDQITAIFPYSPFELFSNGAFFLTIFVFACFIGAA
jgi:Na+/H+-dicarboxylate symporter